MIEKLKKDAILAYHQLINVGLGKYSRGIVSVVSRETNTIVFKTAKSTIVTNLTDDKEELQQHISIYRAFPAVNAVVQPYAKYATVFSQIGIDIPLLGTFHEDCFLKSIPCISSFEELVQTFSDHEIEPNTTPAILLLHNGAYTWGQTPDEAVNNASYLEEVASLAYLSLQLDPGIMPYK